MLSDYVAVAAFICVSIIVSLVLGILPIFFSVRNPYSEKLSTYECGFTPTSSARKTFDIKFYLVSMLFIIFDLEIIFLFPWATSLSKIGYGGFWSMMIFLAILIVGLVYEWTKGALEWE
ncbi:NADH-quinone oxidoreductase subunit A [Wolbachia endosymbiont of Pentidionis agamae]|uniref:NADH-quinone oxidoreductase subunit A n=1 Tax=Wolbachia endosymbiont of Pentidionis agamae TaxID=3110435 RepID=UPI002FD042BD